jgi:hypothetical protein
VIGSRIADGFSDQRFVFGVAFRRCLWGTESDMGLVIPVLSLADMCFGDCSSPAASPAVGLPGHFRLNDKQRLDIVRSRDVVHLGDGANCFDSCA